MSTKTIETVKIDHADFNTRLDKILNDKLDCLPSRALASKLIQQGCVSLNGKTITKPATLFSEPSIIKVDVSFLTENKEAPKGEDIPLQVIYEDDDILVINKEAHMVVHPGAGNSQHTLVNAILSHCQKALPSLGEKTRAGIVHRLDKETSGVIVIAKSLKALTHLSKQFSLHSQKRVYEALVYGLLKDDKGVIETKITRDKKNRILFRADSEQGRTAITEYTVKKRYYKAKLSFVECRLKTGRTHQIRVHMKHLHHAVVGDKHYKTPNQEHLIPKNVHMYLKKHVTHQLLHAKLLGLKHPKNEQDLEFSAKRPLILTNVLQFLDDFEKSV